MQNKFYSKVFMWLFIGLLVTFVSSYTVATSRSLLNIIFGGSLYWLIFIAQIVIVIYLSVRIHKMSPNTAKMLYLLYAILTGITLATMFLLFKVSSIIFVLLTTSILFLIFAFIGATTKIELNKLGTYLFMGLLGVIILEIINIFLMNYTLDMTLCVVAIVLFLGFIAYDMQKISRVVDDENDNLAIIGAFELYLDFINIFVELLKLFGKSRD